MNARLKMLPIVALGAAALGLAANAVGQDGRDAKENVVKIGEKAPNFTLTGPARGRKTGRFFPVEVPGVTYDQPRITIDGDRFRIEVKVNVNPNNDLGRPMKVGGLVTLGSKLDDPCYDFELPLPAPTAP